MLLRFAITRYCTKQKSTKDRDKNAGLKTENTHRNKSENYFLAARYNLLPLPFRYKITVNWSIPQAVLSEQIKQVLSTQHKAPFWVD